MSFSNFLAPWSPNVYVGALECCTNGGQIYQNQTGSGFTTAATWTADAVNWTSLLGGSGANVGNALPIADASTASAGSSISASRTDHVHPRVNWSAADHSLISWTFDPLIAQSSTSLATAGTLYVAKLHVAAAASVTNVVGYLTTLGVTLTSGENFAALYQGGSLIGTTGDQTASWASPGAAGLKTMALSGGPYAVAAGDVQVALWFNGTTGPKFASGQGTGAQINAGLAAASARFGTANTSTTTAAPATLGTTSTGNGAFWIALS